MKKWKQFGSLGIIAILLLSMFGILSGFKSKSEAYITDITQLNKSKYTGTLDAGSTAAGEAKKAFPNLNADFTIDGMGFDSLAASLQSVRPDFVVPCLNVAGERKEATAFSESSETAEVVRSAPETSNVITNLADLEGKTIGCITGSAYIQKVKENIAGSTVLEYATYSDLIASLKSGKIDAYVTDEPMSYFQIKETDGLTAIHEMITDDSYGFMLNKNNTELCEKMNQVLQKFREQGVLDELKEKWITSDEAPDFDTAQPWEKPNGTLKVCLSLDSIPFAYLQDEKIVGYDVELMYRIAKELGYGVDISSFDFSALVEGVSSGREDVAIGCITYTEERAESVLFTDATYDSGTVAVVLDGTSSAKGFFEKIADSFERTFIRENRWKLVADGLLVTLELSLLTLVFGTLAGFGFSFLLRSKNKIVSGAADTLSRLIDGLPLLIILMVFYYIVFAKTTMPAIWIGVIGLSLDFANTVAGTLNTGVESVDKGQIEAAEAMGYPKWKTFMKITFPQAVNRMFSQYTGSVIGMVKGTSIIGYITITDLTKAGDIIRSLTYEAFFPLVSIAVIYFVLAQLIVVILKLIAKRINPKHRKRQVKGVKVHD